MNIFKMELRKQIKFLIIAVITILAVEFTFQVVVKGIYLENESSIRSVFKKMPEISLKSLGINLDTMFTNGGFYGFSYLFNALALAALGTYASLSIFSREKNDKCEEFIMTKPVSRNYIAFHKWLVVLVTDLIIAAFYSSVLLITFQVREPITFDSKMILLVVTPFLTLLTFSSIGCFVSTVSKGKIPLAIATAVIVIIAFMLTALAGIINEKWATIISPIDYFSAQQIIDISKISLSNILAFLTLNTLGIVLSIIIFNKKDVS